LLGEQALQRLETSRVAVVGVGAVGGFCLEALARSAVGSFLLLDNDTFEPSNANRQIGALESTMGVYKTKALEARVKDINPEASVTTVEAFLDESNLDLVFSYKPDLIIDAIDSLASKACLLNEALKRSVKVVSAMGAARKTDAQSFRIADLQDTTVCPLARRLRTMVKGRGITAVYSVEPARSMSESFLSSAVWVTGSAGLYMAQAAVSILIQDSVSDKD